MRIKAIVFTFFVVALFVVSLLPARADDLVDKTQEQITKIITAPGKKFICQGEIICGASVIPRFYERRNYNPAWSDKKGLTPQVKTLVDSIHKAHLEGLRTEDYHHDVIEALIGEIESHGAKKENINPSKLAEIDILLTDVFLMYSSHLLSGRVNPETIHTEWIPFIRTADLSTMLEEALEKNQIEEKLKDLLPPHPGYARLKQALEDYREIANKGGWSYIPSGSSIHKNERDRRVPAIRKRLIVLGDFDAHASKDTDIFDSFLYEAVLRFQRRHGLEVDGIVGPRTLAALNTSPTKRVRQIELNLERWRWLPHDFGTRYLLINIASYQLYAVDNGKQVLDMRVVVGKPYRRTPVFSSKIKHMIVNPYWYVPRKLAVKDILPKARRNPGYLTANKIRVYQSSKSVSPYAVNWSTVSNNYFPYRFRQDPGPKNALGRIKFIFPNKFSVYLHDTPSQSLFSRYRRTFSSGCIRVQRPLELAEYLLKNDPAWNINKIQLLIRNNKHRLIKQPDDVFVHLVYWTAWVDDKGNINFRDDVYDRDTPLDKALKEKPPLPIFTS
jgi:murein L,D-transpeptidase YcbB/YkuD